jgi:hypothetical protein
VLQFPISLHLDDLYVQRLFINIHLPEVQFKVLCSMLHIMQGIQLYSPAGVIQCNEMSLEGGGFICLSVRVLDGSVVSIRVRNSTPPKYGCFVI